MSLSSAVSRIAYLGDGDPQVFSYPFKIFLASDLEVVVKDLSEVETVLTITTDYTVAGAGDGGGGTISLVDSSQAWLDSGGDLLTGFVLTIRRVRPIIQSADIRNQGSFYPEGHEDAFDKAAMVDQQQQDELDRSLKGAVSDDALDMTLPAALDRADKFLTFDSSGLPNATAFVASSVAAASQAEAEAGSENTKYMTALRVQQKITSDIATQVEAEGGTNNTQIMTPLRVFQSIDLKLPQSQSTKTGTYTALSTDNIIYCDTSGGAFEIDLPAASAVPNKRYVIQYTDSGFANALTLDPNLTDTINGAATITLNTERETVELVSDGVSNWVVLRRDVPIIQSAYTPTITGFGTPTGVDFKHSRNGPYLIVEGKFIPSSSTAVEAQITLPTGLTIKSGDPIRACGFAFSDVADAFQHHILSTGGDAFFNMGRQDAASGGLSPAAGNSLLTAADVYSFRAQVEIEGWDI